MEFMTWENLATLAGAVAMVTAITQLIKNIGVIAKIPTQIVSYVLALLVLFPAYYFTNMLTTDNIVLIFFNGVLVALASNGGFDAVKRIFNKEQGEV